MASSTTKEGDPSETGSPIAPITLELDGKDGPLRLWLHPDYDEEIVRDALLDPDRFIPAPQTDRQAQKLSKRRAVYSFSTQLKGEECRLFLKFYRVTTLKDFMEEILLGRRALRSLEIGLETEQRNIPVAIHLGASTRPGPLHIPARSVLLMLGLPRKQDTRTVLLENYKQPEQSVNRRRFLAALGTYLGEVHRAGLFHSDLKLRNVFVVSRDPPRFALIDLDRSKFMDPSGERALLSHVIDLRGLLSSMRTRCSRRERRLLLAHWLRARKLEPKRRRRLLGLLNFLFRI